MRLSEYWRIFIHQTMFTSPSVNFGVFFLILSVVRLWKRMFRWAFVTWNEERNHERNATKLTSRLSTKGDRQFHAIILSSNNPQSQGKCLFECWLCQRYSKMRKIILFGWLVSCNDLDRNDQSQFDRRLLRQRSLMQLHGENENFVSCKRAVTVLVPCFFL